jgi:hypothetical protein
MKLLPSLAVVLLSIPIARGQQCPDCTLKPVSLAPASIESPDPELRQGDVFIPRSLRVQNQHGSCGWASLKTILRYHGLGQVDSQTPLAGGVGDYTLTNYLDRIGVPYEVRHSGTHDWNFLASHLPAVIYMRDATYGDEVPTEFNGVGRFRPGGSGHAAVCVGVDNQSVRIISNIHPRHEVQVANRADFDRRWEGFALCLRCRPQQPPAPVPMPIMPFPGPAPAPVDMSSVHTKLDKIITDIAQLHAKPGLNPMDLNAMMGKTADALNSLQLAHDKLGGQMTSQGDRLGTALAALKDFHTKNTDAIQQQGGLLARVDSAVGKALDAQGALEKKLGDQGINVADLRQKLANDLPVLEKAVRDGGIGPGLLTAILGLSGMGGLGGLGALLATFLKSKGNGADPIQQLLQMLTLVKHMGSPAAPSAPAMPPAHP